MHVSSVGMTRFLSLPVMTKDKFKSVKLHQQQSCSLGLETISRRFLNVSVSTLRRLGIIHLIYIELQSSYERQKSLFSSAGLVTSKSN